ncbi:MAG: aldo/keto reductase family oxidoreductase [Ruminococcaceae bacterium]|nr:aldo/keto reductase family oxidoreductase [Oscillospiraceae bacterium]
MKYINTYSKDVKVSQIALGCMRIADMNVNEAEHYIQHALECGYNYFDHADIYGNGACEAVFGKVLAKNPALRERIVIQTKCGIRPGMYDFSKEHILYSVEQSLKRLGVEKIDVLLLHRPDLLMEPEVVAEAFDELEQSGKVQAFGVSNHSALQIELLQKYVKQPLTINQMQLSVVNAGMVSSGANVNLRNEDGVNYDGYLRDYCRLHEITVQPWSPLQHGFIAGAFLGNDAFSELNQEISQMAEKYQVTDTAMAIAWLLRLPEQMQPIVGSINEKRIAEIAKASEIELSREDWYKIYLKAGYRLP